MNACGRLRYPCCLTGLQKRRVLASKRSEEKIAHLLLPELDAYLNELTNALFKFLGISAAGLFMPERHRPVVVDLFTRA